MQLKILSLTYLLLIFMRYINLLRDSNKQISNQVIVESITDIMKLMMPFIPHLSHECLEKLKCKTTNIWPKIERNLLPKLILLFKLMGKLGIFYR